MLGKMEHMSSKMQMEGRRKAREMLKNKNKSKRKPRRFLVHELTLWDDGVIRGGWNKAHVGHKTRLSHRPHEDKS